MGLDGPRGCAVGPARAELRNKCETLYYKVKQPAPERAIETMDKTEFISALRALNADIHKAIANGNFDEVRFIDGRRQELLHRIIAEDNPEIDENLFECLEGLASEVAQNIKQVEKQFSGFSRRASGRFKVLDGYRI